MKAIISKIAIRKAAAITLLAVSTVSSFAMLGDGRERKPKTKTLLTQSNIKYTGTFSLKSGYNYRGQRVFDLNKTEKFIDLNTVVTYQKGNTTYIIPLKKKVYVSGNIQNGIILRH